jgi:hypothetical protein
MVWKCFPLWNFKRAVFITLNSSMSVMQIQLTVSPPSCPADSHSQWSVIVVTELQESLGPRIMSCGFLHFLCYCSFVVMAVNNKHLYTPNSEIHKYRTRYNNDLHLSNVNLVKYTAGPYFSAKKIYNHLPEYIKSLSSDQKRFKYTLKRFLCQHSFYSIQE